MAKPIRNTPILTGKDAECFIHSAEEIPSAADRRTERNRLENSVSKFKSILSKLPK